MQYESLCVNSVAYVAARFAEDMRGEDSKSSMYVRMPEKLLELVRDA
jgi:hypothetical protein